MEAESVHILALAVCVVANQEGERAVQIGSVTSNVGVEMLESGAGSGVAIAAQWERRRHSSIGTDAGCFQISWSTLSNHRIAWVSPVLVGIIHQQVDHKRHEFVENSCSIPNLIPVHTALPGRPAMHELVA